MLFISIKGINWLRKDRNRLLSKRMSTIYSKVTIEKNWPSQNFDFLSLKLKIYVLKPKSPRIVLKNINFNKNETEIKMENPTYSLRETNLVVQLI